MASARSVGSTTLVCAFVAIPIRLYTATSAQQVSFNRLHKCGSRLGQQMICKAENVPVVEKDIVKGYEYAPDSYVKFTPEELERLQADRPDEIELVEFVPASTVDLLHVEKSQYLGPDKGGDEAYRLFALALELEKRVGVGRWRTPNKDTLVVVRPHRDGLVLHTVFYATEIRDFDDVPRGEQKMLHASALTLARKMIAQRGKPAFGPERFRDAYAQRVKEAVQAKRDGEEYFSPPETQRAPVLDLMDALKRSVAQTVVEPKRAGKNVRKTAAAPPARTSRARRAAAG